MCSMSAVARVVSMADVKWHPVCDAWALRFTSLIRVVSPSSPVSWVEEEALGLTLRVRPHPLFLCWGRDTDGPLPLPSAKLDIILISVTESIHSFYLGHLQCTVAQEIYWLQNLRTIWGKKALQEVSVIGREAVVPLGTLSAFVSFRTSRPFLNINPSDLFQNVSYRWQIRTTNVSFPFSCLKIHMAFIYFLKKEHFY